jgi:hypothetical protein
MIDGVWVGALWSYRQRLRPRLCESRDRPLVEAWRFRCRRDELFFGDCNVPSRIRERHDGERCWCAGAVVLFGVLCSGWSLFVAPLATTGCWRPFRVWFFREVYFREVYFREVYFRRRC